MFIVLQVFKLLLLQLQQKYWSSLYSVSSYKSRDPSFSNDALKPNRMFMFSLNLRLHLQGLLPNFEVLKAGYVLETAGNLKIQNTFLQTGLMELFMQE